ncbi:MAG: anthranilate synthase component I [Acutalibacteraceae bacterium]|nr:anthranilate synthase component I [Acutalibacteraceae bacterium]
MFKPEIGIIRNLAKNYDVIPVTKEIYADISTPITLLRKISAISKRYYLLESVEGGEKWGRYSFIGFDPKSRIYYKNGKVTIEGEGAKEVVTNKPFDIIREFLKDYKTPKLENIPPFTGGLVGYFGYSMIAVAEPILKLRESEFNDFDLMFFDKVVAYDHLTQKISVIVNMKTYDVEYQYKKACDDIENIISIITEQKPLPKTKSFDKVDFKSNMTEEDFCEMVEKTKKYIYNGDVFQCVVSRRFETTYEGSLIDAYRVLRVTNPSPYMVYIMCDGNEIISTSPETLVRLKDGRLSTYPVAGSRPRGKNKAEDDALVKDLLSDEKELAEHNMLVDLGRNDIGKISKINSVDVTAYMVINKYSKIMHIASEVEGDIRDDKDAFDAVESVLPAGTLSGAPKIRACEIIEELEQYPRGIYGGALGYIDFNGNLDVAIAIRMAVKKEDKVYVQAGAGIVADSVPHSEYIETYNKALAVMNAVKDAATSELP